MTLGDMHEIDVMYLVSMLHLSTSSATFGRFGKQSMKKGRLVLTMVQALSFAQFDLFMMLTT
jgi:hypothetical protein